jgi:hypothetical protein
MALTISEKRNKKLRTLHKNIEAQIFMLDDEEDLMILGSLYLVAAKDIFLAQYTNDKTRDVMMSYIKDATE